MNRTNIGLVFLGAALLAAPLVGACVARPKAAPQADASRQTASRQPAAAVLVPNADSLVVPDQSDAGRLLVLQGALNARSFAGLQGRNGAIPAGAFLRTADLGRLTPADRDLLSGQGVSLDVDLRTAEEEAKSHDVLADDARFKYTRISLLGQEKLDLSNMPGSLGELYVTALDANQAQFRKVLQTIAAQPDGTVLFHCTAGKDRTGMIAALLLSLAGVPEQDIVHNYAISAYYLKPMMAQMASQPEMVEMLKANPQLAAMMGTPVQAMQAFLAKLQQRYGGADAYLRRIGLRDAEVRALLVRLGQG